VPCFDQPDVKASATFNIILPEGWISVANEPEKYKGNYTLFDYE
jgi:aminopeptidase N